MSNNNDGARESQITRDRETVREWAREHDAKPVRHTGRSGERSEYVLLPESDHSSDHERVDWDEFHEALERDDLAVVYHGSDGDRTFQVLEHDAAVSQSSLSSDEVTDRLMEGETVTTEVTETTVVEETIVEHADIESEVIGTERIRESVVDSELLSRDVGDCEVVGLDEQTTVADHGMFEVGFSQSEKMDVEVNVEEQWRLTKELVDQVAIESRVVDTDVEGTGSIEADTVETRVDLGDVQRTLLESDVIDAAHTDADVMETKAIQSGFTEDDTVVTELIERKTVEEELTVDRRFSGTIDESETTQLDTVHSEVIESEMTDADEYELAEMERDDYEMPESNIPAGAGTDRAEVTQDNESDSVFEDDEETRIAPEDDDQGKTVVDSEGDEVGIVAEVRSGTMYVDPHPSLTDRIKAKLDWGEMNEDSYVLETNQIAGITDDKVHLKGYQ